MKKQLFILPLLFCLVLVSVSAAYNTEYVFKDSNGNDLTNVDVVIYDCLDANCQSVRVPSFGHTGNSDDSAPNNNIIVHYPRTMETENGYAVYFYRTGYLPLEYFVQAYGYGSRTVTKTFSKKQYCSAPIDSVSVLNEVEPNEPVQINVKAGLDATAHSAFSLAGGTPWYVPQEYKEEHYSAVTKVEMMIRNVDTGTLVRNENKYVTIYADDQVDVDFTWVPTVSGNYVAIVETSVPDSQCDDSTSLTEQANKAFRVLSGGPSNMCYTLLNDLSIDDIRPEVGQTTHISANKLSFYADDTGALTALPTDVNLEIRNDVGVVYTEHALLAASETPLNFNFSWTPTLSDAYSVSVSALANTCPVSENQGENETIGVNVTGGLPENHDPVLIVANQRISEGNLLTYTLSATDVDGDRLLFDASALPDGAILDRNTGVFTWTPDYNTVSHGLLRRMLGLEKEFTIPVVVSDGRGGSDSESFVITVDDVNRNPVIESISDLTFEEGSLVVIAPIVNDADDDNVVISISEPLVNGRWQTGAGDAGTYPITITVQDGFGGSAETLFTLTIVPLGSGIEHDPVIISNPITSALLDAHYTYDVEAFDADGDTLRYSLIEWPTGMSIESATGFISWYPGNENSFRVKIQVEDSTGRITSQSFTLRVGREISTASRGTNHKISLAGMSLLDDSIIQGESLELFGRIKNQGNVKDTLSVRVSIPDLGIQQQQQFTLRPNQGKLLMLSFPLEQEVLPGDYLVVISVDGKKQHLTKYLSFEVAEEN